MSATGNNITPAVQKSRSWMTWMILAAFGVVVLSVITYKMATYKSKPSEKVTASTQASIPLASAPLSTWTKLELPPKVGGRVDIPVHPGYRPMISGDDNFAVHTVYSDGHECVRASEGEGSDTVCPTGAVEVYVTNKMAKENPISYAYEQI